MKSIDIITAKIIIYKILKSGEIIKLNKNNNLK